LRFQKFRSQRAARVHDARNIGRARCAKRRAADARDGALYTFR